jgi:diguanylate cyclase (GGDEF)-like protein
MKPYEVCVARKPSRFISRGSARPPIARSTRFATLNLDVPSGLVRSTARLREMFGLPDLEGFVPYGELLNAIHPADLERVVAARNAAIASKEPYQIDFRLVRPGGQLRHVRSIGEFRFGACGEVARDAATITDITDDVHSEARIAHLLTHDRLTGLADRDAFIEAVRRAIFRADSNGRLAVGIFGIDDFRRLSSTLGSDAGDRLLKAIGSRLRALSGNTFVCGRVGGDEFGVMFSLAQGGPSAESIFADVRRKALAPIDVENRQICLRATAGIAVYPDDAADVTLYKKAHLAMDAATRMRSVRPVRFRETMEAALTQRYTLETELHDALTKSQLEVMYQPLVDARTLEVRAAEALLRWQHPRSGLLLPSAFLSTAVDAGVITEIDRWVMRTACAHASGFMKSAPHLRVHVNVTAEDLHDRSFARQVSETVIDAGIAPGTLTLEVTEQALIVDQTAALHELRKLHGLGVRIALDDFGTHYNTLAHLKLLPVSEVKIDRSFVADVGHSPASRALCRGIVAIASDLGIETTAEGVETEEQERFLIDVGCQSLQGYRYGRAVPAEELARSLNNANP